jgi:hypothetical protein
MDAKITLSFDEDIIIRAKQFAEDNNISLSRLTEFLLNKVTSATYRSLDDLPVSDWVGMVCEGEVEYLRTPPSRKNLKEEYFESKRKPAK